MGFIDNGNNGMFMPVGPVGYGGGGFGNGFGGDGAWWLLVLLFAMGGWNNGGGWTGNGTNAEVQRGFDQQAVMTGLNGISAGINGIQQTMCNSFANVESNANARQIANMQQDFAMQSAFQECCCENRLATANLATSFSNGLRDVNDVNVANTQRIVDTTNNGFRNLYDKICQVESDGIKRDYENRIAALENALQNERQANLISRFNTSQDNQTARIEAGQRALASEVEQYIVPTARPAWIVDNPNCCPNNGYGFGCSR